MSAEGMRRLLEAGCAAVQTTASSTGIIQGGVFPRQHYTVVLRWL